MKKTNKKITKRLATVETVGIKGGMIREVVVARLAELGFSKYKLAQMVAGKVGGPTVYDYLAGRNDITGARLAIILEALGLKITSAPDNMPGTTSPARKPSKRR